MKRILNLALCLMLITVSAFADPLSVDPTGISGELFWPDNAAQEDAVYCYRYSYPQISENEDLSDDINENFYYLVENARGFLVPMNAEMLESTDILCYTNVVSEITCNNDDYFSVLIHQESNLGAGVNQVLSAFIFARNGAKKGTIVSLPWVLGLLTEAENDTWLEDRQTTKANELVWGLIWEIIQEQMCDGQINFDPDLDEEMLRTEFYPQDDFYLDEYGNLVFYIQEATIASAADGVLLYPFTIDELLDEI